MNLNRFVALNNNKMNQTHHFSLTPNLTLLIGHPGFGGKSHLLRFSAKPGMSDEKSQIWCQGRKFILLQLWTLKTHPRNFRSL